jgi:hypothetical protein
MRHVTGVGALTANERRPMVLRLLSQIPAKSRFKVAWIHRLFNEMANLPSTSQRSFSICKGVLIADKPRSMLGIHSQPAAHKFCCLHLAGIGLHRHSSAPATQRECSVSSSSSISSTTERREKEKKDRDDGDKTALGLGLELS